MKNPTLARLTHALLRIVSGFLMAPHGAAKLFGWFGGMQGHAAPRFLDLLWVAGVIEFFGGALLALGAFTRPVAFIMSGEMAVAYFKGHARGGFWPIVNHGELAVLYCFILLFIAAAGGGPIGIDALRGKRG